MKSGADLTQSRHVIYYSYAPTEPVAQAMAREAETKGFDAATREAPPELPGQWSVISEIDAVTSPEFVRESDDFFQGLADRTGPGTTVGRRASETQSRDINPQSRLEAPELHRGPLLARGSRAALPR
jgi:hypothetical protein